MLAYESTKTIWFLKSDSHGMATDIWHLHNERMIYRNLHVKLGASSSYNSWDFKQAKMPKIDSALYKL